MSKNNMVWTDSGVEAEALNAFSLLFFFFFTCRTKLTCKLNPEYPGRNDSLRRSPIHSFRHSKICVGIWVLGPSIYTMASSRSKGVTCQEKLFTRTKALSLCACLL